MPLLLPHLWLPPPAAATLPPVAGSGDCHLPPVNATATAATAVAQRVKNN